MARVKQTAADLEAQFRLLKLTSEQVALEHENAGLRDAFSGAAADVQSLEQLKLRLEVRRLCLVCCRRSTLLMY